MLSLKGVLDGKTIKLIEPVPDHKKGNVMVTIVDDIPQTENELIGKYTHYYQALDSQENIENSSLEDDFSCADTEAEDILEGQDK